MSNLELRPLTPEDLPALHAAMLDAFLDYPVPMQPSAAAFEQLVRRRGTDWSISIGAFESSGGPSGPQSSDGPSRPKGFGGPSGPQGSTLAAFTLSARTGSLAYDVMSGVRRAFQGQGLIARLFAELWPRLREHGISAMQLEVITSNARAIRAYEKLGFVRTRRLVCLRGPKLVERPVPDELEIVDATTLDWPTWTRWWTSEPAWPSAIASVERTEPRIQLEARWRGQPAGYLLAIPETGDLLQLAVVPELRRCGIGHALLEAASQRALSPEYRVLNVDSHQSSTIDWFRARSWVAFVEQWEMRVDLSSSAPRGSGNNFVCL